ncbi:SPX domain-containing protein [Chaetomium fimeti]|jgi:E3 ubiquitin-protein ligase BAH|uniref:SPX domain-containing protein n=1 Tax=Chaetomium fimeti TaxID=1854472 RepID=A0AAE0HRR0_9PEZI|nr:SPX domain-containing protein [Chaetomium fimeti]
MKFGHAFQEALAADSYPQHWVEKAIPYRQLKKILGKVREELIKKGYDPDTLHQLLTDRNAEYRLETDAFHLLRPRLVVRPSLSLEHAAVAGSPSESPLEPDGANAPRPPERGQGHESYEADEWVKIPLSSDVRFFGLLQTDVTQLDTLQDEERQSMNDKIKNLGSEIAEVAKPRKGMLNLSKSDLYRWREIFELYLAAQVFFSTYEVAGGLRKSEKAQKQLVWFQDEVNKRQLPQKFKIESSTAAYAQFLALNATLLQNLQFQELNQTAVIKIIKKFDKRTSLGVKGTFPKVMYSANFISETISKDICAQLAREVVSLVPQVVDYSCTICLSLCWLPIRLDCKHLFCIRCMIKMQNQNKRYCPLCRADVVQNANETHIDDQLVRYLERWFPKETKEKQVYNEIERRRELFGDIYVGDRDPAPCTVM